MRTLIRPLAVALLLAISCTAFGAGGGSMPTPSDQKFAARSPELEARQIYNSAVHLVEKGDDLLADAARQTDARKQKKAQDKAQQAYGAALRKFVQVLEMQPAMYEAWNYTGYAQRKLGHYQDALTAYDRALSLKPGYPEAIEYRGHAYLGLDRLSEAKQAYLTLYSGNRKLAATLLTAMQQWVGSHRTNAAGIDGPMLESFASWVNERSTIAGQTVGLTREGAASAWH
ncbi:MAG: tetratricopeptide repeat protein [Pseudomonadota bacterium]